MRLLIVSDRPVISRIVADLCRRDMDVDVQEAPDARACRDAVETWHPDVAFVDLAVPERELRRLCAELAEQDVRTVVLSAEADEALRMLESGVAGISLTTDGLEGLLRALDTVAGGNTHLPPSLLGGVLRGLIERQREQVASPTRAVDRLSHREREVLALLGEGCDQRGIARRLDISPQTAKTHIRHVLHKLGARSRLEAVALAADLEHSARDGS